MVLPGAMKYNDQSSSIGANLRHDLTRRSMTNSRLVLTVLSLLLALFMTYVSFFYFPAYMSGSAILKVASQSGHYPASTRHKDDQTVLERYLDYLIMNRGYLNEGQAVKVRYARGEDTELTLIASRCAGPIIWEILACDKTEVKRITAKRIDGETMFSVPQSGFYQFDEVTTLNGPTAPAYDVIWSRFER